MAIPGTLTAFDTFERTDNPVEAGAGAAIWTSSALGGGANGLKIVSGRIEGETSNGTGDGLASVVVAADQAIVVNYQSKPTGSGAYTAIFFGVTNGTVSGWSGYLAIWTADDNTWLISRHDPGAGTVLGSVVHAVPDSLLIDHDNTGSRLALHAWNGTTYDQTPFLEVTGEATYDSGTIALESNGPGTICRIESVFTGPRDDGEVDPGPETGPFTYFVDKDSGTASDAHTRTVAQDPALPMATLQHAVNVAGDGDEIRLVQSGVPYAAFTIEGRDAQPSPAATPRPAGGITISSADPDNRAVVDSYETHSAGNWTYRDLDFGVEGVIDNPSMRDTTLGWEFDNCRFLGGGGYISGWDAPLHWTGGETQAVFDPAQSSNFINGKGWTFTPLGSGAPVANLAWFEDHHFHHVGGEDATQWAGYNLDGEELRLTRCKFNAIHRDPASPAHTDCLQVMGGRKIHVDSCEFRGFDQAIIGSDGGVREWIIENCLFVGAVGQSGISLQFVGLYLFTFRQNTVVGSQLGGLRLNYDSRYVLDDIDDNPLDPVLHVYNNIIDLCSVWELEAGFGISVADQDWHHNDVLTQQLVPGDLPATAIPEFGHTVDTDYELATTPIASPGINAGAVVVGSPTVDRLGRPRVGAPDLGCHEADPATRPVTADARAPYVLATSPSGGSSGVSATTNVTATLYPIPGTLLDPATIGTGTVRLRDPGGAVIPAIVSVDLDTAIITLDPIGTLYPYVSYHAELAATVADADGNALGSARGWDFRIAGPYPAPAIVAEEGGGGGEEGAEPAPPEVPPLAGSSAAYPTVPDSSNVYGVDLRLSPTGDLIVGAHGGIAFIQGPENMVQALQMRARTYPGELPLHPAYGSGLAARLLGAKAGDVDLARAQANQETAAIIRADPRFLAARNIATRWDPDHPTRLIVSGDMVLAAGELLAVGDLVAGDAETLTDTADVDLDSVLPDDGFDDPFVDDVVDLEDA